MTNERRAFIESIIKECEQGVSYARLSEIIITLGSDIPDLKKLNIWSDHVQWDTRKAIGLLTYYLLQQDEPKDISTPLVSVVNENKVNIDMNITFDMAIEKIQDDGSLSDFEKAEIINEIQKIKEISNTKEKKTAKWAKIKPVLLWLGDKGVDVGIALLPLLYQAITSMP